MLAQLPDTTVGNVAMLAVSADLQDQVGITFVTVTHDQDEALSMACRIAVMNKGTIQQIATTTEIYERPASTFVGGFVGNPPMNFLRLPVAEGAARLGAFAGPVAAGATGSASLVAEGITGRLVAPSGNMKTDAAAFADALAPYCSDPALRAATPPGAVLFVFAKRVDGAGPPVAAKRLPVSAFPIQLELSDADSIMPTATLSRQSAFTLSARISASGSAEAGAGDWQSETRTVQSDKLAPVTLVLRKQP